MDPIIFHIDVNSAFLSWSAVKLLKEGYGQDIREIPAIVGGDQTSRHGIVVAKSIPAKKYGIQTADTVASALRRCPNLVVVPPEHGYYREQSRRLMSFLSEICPVIEQVSIDECYMDYEPLRMSRPDPLKAAYDIKNQVRETFGFTVNIGISDRKVLAKMASDFQKPDKVHTLYQREIREKLWPLPIEELHMCGKSTAGRLRMLGIKTIGELAGADKTMIASLFKKHGIMLQNYANGIDNARVKPEKEKAKGIGRSETLSSDVTDANEAYGILRKLSADVAGRLKKNGVKAGTICVEIKYSDFQSASHQAPLRVRTDRAQELCRAACVLFDELWDRRPVRLLGVRATRFEEEPEYGQLDLFTYQEQMIKEEKNKKLDAALEKIRERFGEDAIKKGKTEH